MTRRTPRPPRIYTETSFRVALVLFYAVSLVLVLLPGIEYLEAVSWGLAFCAGVAVVAITRRCNVWVLFTVGFIQPLVIIIPAAIEIPYILQYSFSLWPPLRVGLACAAGGWLLSLVRSGPSARDFLFSDWREWIAPSWALLGRAEKLQQAFTTIMGLATLLAAILGYLQ